MVSLWPFRVSSSPHPPPVSSPPTHHSPMPGRGQLSSIFRKSPRRTLHQDHSSHHSSRPPPPTCPPLQSPLDSLHHLRLPPLFDYHCSSPRVAELGNHRIRRDHRWPNPVRSQFPLIYSLTATCNPPPHPYCGASHLHHSS